MARLLLGITLLAMLAPACLLVAPPPWIEWLMAPQVIIWMMVLIFLLLRAQAEKNRFHG